MSSGRELSLTDWSILGARDFVPYEILYTKTDCPFSSVVDDERRPFSSGNSAAFGSLFNKSLSTGLLTSLTESYVWERNAWFPSLVLLVGYF